MTRKALVAGSTGISGINLVNLLVAEGWRVCGLTRLLAERSEVFPVRADLAAPCCLDLLNRPRGAKLIP